MIAIIFEYGLTKLNENGMDVSRSRMNNLWYALHW